MSATRKQKPKVKLMLNEYEVQRADQILFRSGVEDSYITDEMRLKVLKSIGLRK
jgi:hypothetical protein